MAMCCMSQVSPCARDAIHTRNTLNHVCDLGAYGEASISNCSLNLPLYQFNPSEQLKPMQEWTEEEVSIWLGQVQHPKPDTLALDVKLLYSKRLSGSFSVDPG